MIEAFIKWLFGWKKWTSPPEEEGLYECIIFNQENTLECRWDGNVWTFCAYPVNVLWWRELN